MNLDRRQLYYFNFYFMLGHILSATLNNYMFEKKATSRLKKSVIKKTKTSRSGKTIFNSKKIKNHNIYQFTLGNRGE